MVALTIKMEELNVIRFRSYTVHGYTMLYKNRHQKSNKRASLVAQWLRICLLMQGTRVRALVWEDPTCHGATGPMSHNY